MANNETNKYKFLKMFGIFRDIKEAIKTKGLFGAKSVDDYDVPDEVPDSGKRLTEGLEHLVKSEVIDMDKNPAAINLAYDLQQKGIKQIESLAAVGYMYGARVELRTTIGDTTKIGYTASIIVPNVNGMLPKVQQGLNNFKNQYNNGAYMPKAIKLN